MPENFWAAAWASPMGVATLYPLPLDRREGRGRAGARALSRSPSSGLEVGWRGMVLELAAAHTLLLARRVSLSAQLAVPCRAVPCTVVLASSSRRRRARRWGPVLSSDAAALAGIGVRGRRVELSAGERRQKGGRLVLGVWVQTARRGDGGNRST
jgi:hypothetical protein